MLNDSTLRGMRQSSLTQAGLTQRSPEPVSSSRLQTIAPRSVTTIAGKSDSTLRLHAQTTTARGSSFFIFHREEPKMTEPISYRRANADDVLTVCKLGQILNAVHHRARPDIYANATPEFARDETHWISSLRGEDRAVFLAEQDSTAVGFITVQVMQPTSPLLQPMTVGRIGSVAVSERLRGRGVGSTLMKLAEQWARENGANDVRLTVWAFNEQAVGLYRELGYELRAFEMGKQLPIAGNMPVA
ncbi:Mycothiol acetyltransferase [Paraburkholderia kirstenboschensis]|nr:Mycothiol acetyltransferase [Paraburkholderia kirstenboschensis]